MNEETIERMVGTWALVVMEMIWAAFALTWVGIAIYAAILSSKSLFYLSGCMTFIGLGMGCYIDRQYKKLEAEE